MKGLYFDEHMRRSGIGKIIEILIEFIELYEPERDASRVHWLP